MQTIKLDLQRQSILTPLKAKQNDRYSRFFKVVLLDGSTAFSIPQGAALTVRYIAPSGSGWYDTITEIDNTTKHSAFAISGNEVTVELAEATLTKPGNGMLCLQIYTATGYRIGTWNIPLEIEADPLADSTIAASDYYNVLTGQVAQALGYRDAAANSATAAAASAALAQQISQQSKGWYATAAALRAAHPTGQNGWWAIVGAGDNIWTWDADTNAWVNTHTQTDLSNYYTKAQADAVFGQANQMPQNALTKKVSNVLDIDTSGYMAAGNMVPASVATENAATLTNSPVSIGAFYAYREVVVIRSENSTLHQQIVVKLTEAYPSPGRVWVNKYSNDAGDWSGWTTVSENQFKVQSGNVSTQGTGGWTDLQVTFPTPYKNIPAVIVTPSTQYSNENVIVSNISTTGCKVSVFAPSTGFSYGVYWQAIGLTQ